MNFQKNIAVCILIAWAAGLSPAPLVLAQTSSETASPTLKVSFTIRNAYFNKYGVAWAAATEEQRKAFIKEYNQKEKEIREENRAFKKAKAQADKAKAELKKAEDKKEKARLKAERDRKKAEAKRERELDKKRNALKKKMNKMKDRFKGN